MNDMAGEEKSDVTPGDGEDVGYAGLLWNVVAREVKFTDPGKSFGEIALMSPDNVRNASIIADESTDLMSVSRELFNRSLKAKQIQEYEDRKTFIQESPLFSNWHPKFKRLLEMSLRKECHTFEATIVKQGEPSLGLHFITKGTAKVTMEPSSHKSQYPSIMNRPEVQSEADRIRRVRPRVVDDVTPKVKMLQQENVRIRRREGYAAAEKCHQHALHVCTIGENEYFGDIETLLQLETYTQTVTCTANTEVYILDLKNYERLVKRHQVTVDLLREKAREKLRCRSQTVFGRRVPLLNHLLRMLNELSKPPMEKQTTDNRVKSATSRDKYIKDMVRLYLNNKITALVDSCVPDAMHYKTMSLKKEEARVAAMEKMSPGSLRRGWRYYYDVNTKSRRPRSRRELENLASNSPYSFGQNLSKNKNFLHERRPSIACSLPADDQMVDEMLEELNAVAMQQEDEYHRQTLGLEPPDNNISRESLVNVLNEMGSRREVTAEMRNKIISSLQDKDKSSQHADLWKLTRPKSAPQTMRSRLGSISSCSSDLEDPDEVDYFDKETSEAALRDLEGKVKGFLAKYTPTKEIDKEADVKIQQMRRFELKSAADVPIAGGTVFVRQRECRFPRGSVFNEDGHKHVRHFMLPKNAIATIADERDRIRSAKSTRSLPPRAPSRKVSALNRTRPKSAYVS